MIRRANRILLSADSREPRSIFSSYYKCISTNANSARRESNLYTPGTSFGYEYQHSRENYKYYLCGLVPLLCYLYREEYFKIQILPVAKALSAEVTSPAKSLRAQYNFIADTVEKSAGAVVCIRIKDAQRLDFFYWGHQTMSNGSGFIIEEDGLILTNAHVVSGHPQSIIQVELFDGTVYDGHIETMDVYTDLATIRIKPKTKLPFLKLGQSKDLRPGEFVIAMGSPLALSNTVTSGIISSTNRKSSELHLGNNMHYIQTDASITVGNSGGPLINLDGEVVGINSLKVAEAGGISFAIPVDYAIDFLKRNKNKPHPRINGSGKRYLGLTLIALSPEIIAELQQRYHHIPPEIKDGAIVWRVVVGSPAYKSGLIPGDIVTEINGKHVPSPNALYHVLETDDSLVMKIFRVDRYYEVHVHPENIM